MAVYIAFTLLFVFLVIQYYIQTNRTRLCINGPYMLCVLATSPFIILMSLRGAVGTDIFNYISIIKHILMGNYLWTYEPGFFLYIKLVSYFTKDPLLLCIATGITTTTILLYSVKTSYQAQFVLLACIIPIFYLEMTMNTIRSGLSFSLAMLATSLFYRNRVKISLVIGLISLSIHLSSLIIFLLTLISVDIKNINKKISAIFIALVFISTIIAILLSLQNMQLNLANHRLENIIQFITDKFHSYSNVKSPNIYSGLPILGITLSVVYLIHKEESLCKESITKLTFNLATISVLSFLVAKFSYAGLRLQSAILFGLLINLQFNASFDQIVLKNKKSLMLIGAAGLLLFLKDIALQNGEGSTPFIPWKVNPKLLVLKQSQVIIFRPQSLLI